MSRPMNRAQRMRATLDLDPWCDTGEPPAIRIEGGLVIKGYVVDPADLPTVELLTALPLPTADALPHAS